jgi:hypothetical protein
MEEYKNIITIDTEKAFDKIQHPFMIKYFIKIGTEGNFLNLMRNIYQKWGLGHGSSG